MSDSESDDDLLLSGGPAFGKRKNGRAEAKMDGFIDSLIVKSNERIEKRAKIDQLKLENTCPQKIELSPDTLGAEKETSVASPSGNNENKENNASVPASGNMRPLRTTYDIDDPSYKQKIELALADIGKGGKSKDHINDRRCYLDDLDEMSDQELDMQDGDTEDHHENRKRRAAIATATLTGRSSLLGVRNTLLGNGFGMERNVSQHPILMPFSDDGEVVCELKKVFAKFKKAKASSQENKQVRLAVQRQLMEPMQAILQKGFLPKLLASQIPAQWYTAGVPITLLQWLYRVAISIDNSYEGAFKSLVAILKAGRPILLDDPKFEIIAGTDSIGQRNGLTNLFSFQNVRATLQTLFGLCLDSDALTMSKNDNDEALTKQKSRYALKFDSISLQHFLEIWTVAFELGLVTFEGNNGNPIPDNTNDFLSLAGDTTMALAMCGLDAGFHIGCCLMEPLQLLLKAVLVWTNVQIENMNDSPQLREKAKKGWMQNTSNIIIDSCYALRADDHDSPDEKGANGWLCLSLLARVLPAADFTIHQDTSGIERCCTFKACFIECALQKCLGSCVDWDKEIQEVLEELIRGKECNMINPESPAWGWRALVSAQVAFDAIEPLGNEFLFDGPRFLATIELAHLSILVGLSSYLVLPETPDREPKDQILYQSVAEADLISTMIHNLEEACEDRKKKIPNVFVHPHLRRAKELIMWMSLTYRCCKNDARAMARHKFGDLVQKRIDQWFPDASQPVTAG